MAGGDRTVELIGLVHDIVGMCGGAGGSSSSASATSDSVFKKDCTDLVRRISLLTHLFEEIRDLNYVDFGMLDASTSSTGSPCSWSSDLALALLSARQLLSVARNFRSNCSSVSILFFVLASSFSLFRP